MKLSAKVDLDPMLKRRFELGAENAQAWLRSQIIKDTDPYVPFLHGYLARSVDDESINDDPKLIIWWAGNKKNPKKGYARYQYYSGKNKTRTHHKKATMRWFEASQKVNQENWIKGVKKMFGEGWKEAA